MKLGIFGKFRPLSERQAQTKKKKKSSEEMPKFESKEEYFIKNGGILLEKQIALSQGQDTGGASQLKVITELEIKNATKYYDPNLIVGRNLESIVYKATYDDRTVAIKTPRENVPNHELTDRFLTDVAIGVVVNNTNMVRIYGCCLETCIPMMVYEFYPNQDLYQCLHGEIALETPLKWSRRLSVAADIAYALSYMHNALSKPVVHRDVMANGILLDFTFRAKLGNLGYSVAITPGKKDQKWPVRGTPGYIDPEYVETQEVTEKCDVYSFGVLMIVLVSGREPIEMARCGKDLVDEFFVGGVDEMIDENVLEEGNLDEVNRFVRLAMACVAKKGEERPGMISVVEQLWRIQDQGRKRGGCNQAA